MLALGGAGIAVFQPPLIGLSLAAAIIGGVLLIRHPVWGIYLLVLSVPVQKEIAFGSNSATQGVMAALLFVWWLWMAAAQRKISVPPFALALGAYLLIMIASLVVATSVKDGLAETARWTVVLLAYLIIVNTITTRAQIVGLLVCFVLAAGAEAALGLWQVVTRQVPPSFFVGQGHEPEDLAPRAFGTIGMPNSYAGYLNLTIALALALGIYALVSGYRRWAVNGRPQLLLGAGLLALTALMIGALVVSYSRGGYLGLGCGVTAMAVALGRRAVPALTAVMLGLVLLVGLAFTGGLPASLRDRLASIPDQLRIYDVRGIQYTPDTFNQLERLAHWQAAGSMFLLDPVLGVGIGNFNVVYPSVAVAEWPTSRGHAHNYYLHALAETGLAGLLAYLVLLGTALAGGWRAIRAAVRARQGFDSAVLIGAFGVVLAIMGHSVFEDLHVLNMGIHWAAMIALFYVVPRSVTETSGARAGRTQSMRPLPTWAAGATA
ncbi:MAG TPA: O-antigen ligase family protein [Chloroflexia bacterium]|nr:O-antigen ligase family protein [Chloroflexia bacterium]